MLRFFAMLIAGGARRIIAAGSILIVITIAGAFLSVWDLRRNAIEASRQGLVNLGVVMSEQLLRSIQAVDVVLGETAQHVVRSGAATPEEFRQFMASEASHRFLINRLRALPQASALFMTDAFGNEIN